MSLPRFFARVSDAISPLLAAETDVRAILAEKSVRLDAPDNLDSDPHHLAGFLLLVNLCARLYPEIRVVAPPRVSDECKALALAINPACDLVVGEGVGQPSGTIAWGCAARVERSIVIAPSAWEVLIDLKGSERLAKTNILVALTAAGIGAAGLFRGVFSALLPNGRREAEPGRFNVLTHVPTAELLPELPPDIDLGVVHLVGAGAIGQAAVYTLARVSATGTLVIIDPEQISLSNLQRYVLATEKDVGISKCAVAEQALARTNRLETVCVESNWTNYRGARRAEAVCVAVDSERARIEIQASLPRVIFNAWTQPRDIGWSRHESFGKEPCLACLYWPSHERPSDHQNVARAVRQHELRALAYLSTRLPVDQPLLPHQIPRLADYPAPPESSQWTSRSLLQDIAVSLGIDESDLGPWRGRFLSDLYRDGICGGAIIRHDAGGVPAEMAVPLAHQSVLAGIMLATQLLVAASPALRAFRSRGSESRLDLLSRFPQRPHRPRQATAGCICGDHDFITAHRSSWGEPSR
jgi:hypothetical protein